LWQNAGDNGGREQELDFRTDCAEPSRSSHGSWDFAAENDPAHREPLQHITAASKRQAFLNDADSEQAPSAQHHRRQGGIVGMIFSDARRSSRRITFHRREDVPTN
jgi:hypothetical protein